MDSYEISKFDSSKVYVVPKFLTPETVNLSSQSIIKPPTAKPKAKPKPFLKPRQRKKFLEEQKEATKDDSHIATQWKIEDLKNKKSYSGQPEPRREGAKYVILMNKGAKWSLAPIELYQFRPEVSYQTLTLEEAEVKMKAKTADNRWMMRKKGSLHSRLMDRLQGEGDTTENPGTIPSSSSTAASEDLLQAPDDDDLPEERGEETLPAIEGESKEERLKRLKKKKKKEDQDIDFTETWDDDEEGQVTKARSEGRRT